jgi:hypothetical protein
MPDEKSTGSNKDPGSQATAPRSDERRRLLRGTLAAGPVVMTLASRPVLGQGTCLAASALGSANSAVIRTAATTCSGLTPSQWKTRAQQWPSPYCGVGETGSAATGTATTTTFLASSALSRYVQRTTGSTQTYVAQGVEPTRYHCPTTGLNGQIFGDRTMLEVIEVGEGGGGTQSLGRYIVAALLNARSGRTPVLTETTVRNMWNDCINRGYYEPTAGIRWTPLEIIGYIKTTMT